MSGGGFAGGPRIAVVSASTRRRSQSARVAHHAATLLAGPGEAGPVEILDLACCTPPPWSEDLDAEADAGAGATATREILGVLGRADGIVLVVPEWGGMAPPALKNVFLLCEGRPELADKPALLVGVSSGRGGAYPLAELRMSSYKNSRICYIPEQVVVRDVGELFEGGRWAETPEAKALEAQLVHALRLLTAYARALAGVRRSGVRDAGRFPWNM